MERRPTAPSIRRTARDERGFMLVLALALLLVLVGVALVAAQSTIYEMSYAGNMRVSSIGFNVAYGGLSASVAQAAQNLPIFPGYIKTKNNQTTAIDFPPFFDLDAADGDGTTFGPEVAMTFAHIDNIGFTSTWELINETNKVSGYSTEGFCYQRYEVTTEGVYGHNLTTATPDAKDLEHTAIKRMVSHVTMGPYPCNF